MPAIDRTGIAIHRGAAGEGAPVVYVVDSPEHPFDIAGLAAGRRMVLVTLPVRDWDDGLTPWPAPGLYREEPDFGGHAGETLAELLDEVLPAVEGNLGYVPAKRAVCGYSLGGLFALYAFARSTAFDACACLSGSVWYPGWTDWLREQALDGEGRSAFFTLGTKEKRAAPRILRTVQDKMEECADILRSHGYEVRFEPGPGDHFHYQRERYEAGLSALEGFLSRG